MRRKHTREQYCPSGTPFFRTKKVLKNWHVCAGAFLGGWRRLYSLCAVQAAAQSLGSKGPLVKILEPMKVL